MPTWVQAVLAFTGMAALDMVWARYTMAVMARAPHRAGLLASGIMALNALVTLTYVDDWLMILPAAAGAYAGTWLATRRADR